MKCVTVEYRHPAARGGPSPRSGIPGDGIGEAGAGHRCDDEVVLEDLASGVVTESVVGYVLLMVS